MKREEMITLKVKPKEHLREKTDEACRAIFKLIVQERFPNQFTGVADLKKEVSKVRSAISRLK